MLPDSWDSVFRLQNQALSQWCKFIVRFFSLFEGLYLGSVSELGAY